MSFLRLEIITPDGIAFDQLVASVTVPATEGDIGVFPGHIPILSSIKSGEIVLRSETGEVIFLAVDKGYVRINADVVSILTEAAIDVQDIDIEAAAEALARAQEALRVAKDNPEIDPDEIERYEAISRFCVTQQLIKKKHLKF